MPSQSTSVPLPLTTAALTMPWSMALMNSLRLLSVGWEVTLKLRMLASTMASRPASRMK